MSSQVFRSDRIPMRFFIAPISSSGISSRFLPFSISSSTFFQISPFHHRIFHNEGPNPDHLVSSSSQRTGLASTSNGSTKDDEGGRHSRDASFNPHSPSRRGFHDAVEGNSTPARRAPPPPFSYQRRRPITTALAPEEARDSASPMWGPHSPRGTSSSPLNNRDDNYRDRRETHYSGSPNRGQREMPCNSPEVHYSGSPNRGHREMPCNSPEVHYSGSPNRGQREMPCNSPEVHYSSSPNRDSREMPCNSPEVHSPASSTPFSSPRVRGPRRSPFPTAGVLRVDSSRQTVELNATQRDLVWQARRADYQTTLIRIVGVLQAHRTGAEKLHVLRALHEDEVIRRRLRLRQDTYEEIFHLFYAVAMQASGVPPGHLNESALPVRGCVRWEEEWRGGPAGAGGVHEFATPLTTALAILSPHWIQQLWRMYRYQVDSGTTPSTHCIQHIMGILEHAVRHRQVGPPGPKRPDALTRSSFSSLSTSSTFSTVLLEAKAHSLMMDLARFHLTPTEFTINSYIAICGGCGGMHLAVAAFADYQSRHQRQPSARTYAMLIQHLLRNSHYKEAISAISTMQNVPMTTALLNAVLQAARFSTDPASVFTFYRAIIQGGKRSKPRVSFSSSLGICPDLATFSILLEGIQQDLQSHLETNHNNTKTGHNSASHAAKDRLKNSNHRLDFVLAEMRAFCVRGNGQFLNKLLRVFLNLRRFSQAKALRSAMKAKHVLIFDELHERNEEREAECSTHKRLET
ncbi:unnamed protein product [Phytomonas sp. Hart1]|nr:unnamed protein product [Phytomonas sp. Hart1]|eukprot:CCW71577.1 unnamed protein product [Phytomonas sp. isolate Hart1]